MSGNWYKKGIRHYGRKPHTRRARGLRRTDLGKHHKAIMADVIMPPRTSIKTLEKYFKIYSIYCRAYEKYMSDEMAMYKTLWYSDDAHHSVQVVRFAIRKVEEFKKLNGL